MFQDVFPSHSGIPSPEVGSWKTLCPRSRGRYNPESGGLACSTTLTLKTSQGDAQRDNGLRIECPHLTRASSEELRGGMGAWKMGKRRLEPRPSLKSWARALVSFPLPGLPF